jgi:hypothetical protein
MNRAIIFLTCAVVIIGIALVGAPSTACAQGNTEEAAARVPLENYFKGHATGDGAFMRQAFHPDAKICSNTAAGVLACLTAEEFAARFTGKAPADEAQRKRTIERLDVTGDAAFAKLILDYPAVKFTDYMTLMKVNGEWKIMHKVYFAERRTPPAAR